MRDFLGKTLLIGDRVVLTRPQYRELTIAKVIKFTPQKVRVEFPNPHGSQYGPYEYLSEPDFLVKIVD